MMFEVFIALKIVVFGSLNSALWYIVADILEEHILTICFSEDGAMCFYKTLLSTYSAAWWHNLEQCFSTFGTQTVIWCFVKSQRNYFFHNSVLKMLITLLMCLTVCVEKNGVHTEVFAGKGM